MSDSVLAESTVIRVSGHDTAKVAAAARAKTDIPVVEVGSTGVPTIEPLVIATTEDQSVFYTNATIKETEKVAAAFGKPTRAFPDADATVTHNGSPSLPLPDLDGFTDSQSVLARCGWLRPTSEDDYVDAVGFVDASRYEILDAAGEVLGRGWGDWNSDEPVRALWEGVQDRDGAPAVIVNAHGNPGDVLLAESDPFAVLEGAAHAARVIDAARVFLYISETDDTAKENLDAAAAAYPDFPAPIEIVEGPSAYFAAEPTMAIEAVEGNHRLEARLRPPGPEIDGVYGEPTVIHTARTFAHVANVVRGGNTPSRVFTVTGDAENVTVELDSTDTVHSAIEAAGVTDYTGVLVGGQFGGLTHSLDVAPTPAALDKHDLGTDGVLEVLGPDRCPVAFVGRRVQFAADTNCGRCVPCREGTTQLSELLRDIYDGNLDTAKIEELLRVMESTSICAFGRHAPRPVRTGLREFGDVFDAHANGDCPSGECLSNDDASADAETETTVTP